MKANATFNDSLTLWKDTESPGACDAAPILFCNLALTAGPKGDAVSGVSRVESGHIVFLSPLEFPEDFVKGDADDADEDGDDDDEDVRLQTRHARGAGVSP